MGARWLWRLGWRRRRFSDAEGISDGGEAVAFHGVGEETAASNTNKSAWRNVLQESAEEFIAIEGHEPAAAAVAVILHPERDAGVVDVDEAAVGDGHAVDIVGEVTNRCCSYCQNPRPHILVTAGEPMLADGGQHFAAKYLRASDGVMNFSPPPVTK